MRATVAKRLRRVARITCDSRLGNARLLVHKVRDARHPQYHTAVLETGCYRQVYQQAKKQYYADKRSNANG